MVFAPFATKAAPVVSHPANPASTTSATKVMMGLAVAYTPRSAGIVSVNVTGYLQIATALQVCTVGGRFGTGAAPVNGVAVTGTVFGAGADPSVQPPAVGAPCAVALTDLLTLTPGTTYWLDLCLAVPGGAGADAASLTSLSLLLAETS